MRGEGVSYPALLSPGTRILNLIFSVYLSLVYLFIPTLIYHEFHLIKLLLTFKGFFFFFYTNLYLSLNFRSELLIIIKLMLYS